MPGMDARAPERTETSSRLAGSPKRAAGDAADLRERGVDLRFEFGRMRLAVGVVVVAGVRRDGEAGRHRQAEAAHFGQVGALAAEQVRGRPRCPRPRRPRSV